VTFVILENNGISYRSRRCGNGYFLCYSEKDCSLNEIRGSGELYRNQQLVYMRYAEQNGRRTVCLVDHVLLRRELCN
jgi:hypothetical protein